MDTIGTIADGCGFKRSLEGEQVLAFVSIGKEAPIPCEKPPEVEEEE